MRLCVVGGPGSDRNNCYQIYFFVMTLYVLLSGVSLYVEYWGNYMGVFAGNEYFSHGFLSFVRGCYDLFELIDELN